MPANADEWDEDPFGGRIDHGWVHGRGALDDKGPLIVILEAVEALLAEGFTPARDVYLSFGGDEETYGDAALAIAEHLDNAGIRPWLVIDEGGAVVDAPLPFTRGRAAMIGVGEKGLVTLRLTASSDPGHASAPHGQSAIDRLARAVRRLSSRVFRPRAPLAITRMLQILADRAVGPARPLYGLLARSRILTGLVFAALGGEPAALVRTTIAATLQDGGSAANVLPATASVTFNLRLIPGETVESAARRVARKIRDPDIGSSSRKDRTRRRSPRWRPRLRCHRRSCHRDISRRDGDTVSHDAGLRRAALPRHLPSRLPVRPDRDVGGAARVDPRDRGTRRSIKPRKGAGLPRRADPRPVMTMWAVVGFLAVVEFTSGILQGYYTPMLTDIARELGIHDADVNWFEGTAAHAVGTRRARVRQARRHDRP